MQSSQLVRHAAVAQFQVCEPPAPGVDGKGGEPVAIDVGEAQLRAGPYVLLDRYNLNYGAVLGSRTGYLC